MASDEASDELIGAELAGRYELIAPISSGAMGAVYRARDRETEAEVAVKRLTDVRQAARFEIEARLLEQLRHPRVVRVVDYFSEARARYLVMELVRGPDLGSLLADRGAPGLPAAEAIGYVREACEALEYVHDQMVVHRDVKPANLIAGDDGVVLVDFGIARTMDESEDPGTVGIGTPRYMAPEVFAGGDVSARADVFGLAATLWTLLTGEAPGYDDRTPLAETVADVTPQVEAAIRSGLEFIPKRRIASAASFAQALGATAVAGRGESLARSVPNPVGPRDLMERIVRTAAGVFDAAACSIALTDAPTGDLVYETAWGAGADEIVGVRLQPGTGIAGSVAASGAAEAVDCRNDPRFATQIAEGTGYVPHTMLVVPLARGERTIGVLSLLDRRDGGLYGSHDVERAELFADLAVAALDLRASVG
jgi:serine/threonine-protein kinase